MQEGTVSTQEGFVECTLDNSDGRITGYDGEEVVISRRFGLKLDEVLINSKKSQDKVSGSFFVFLPHPLNLLPPPHPTLTQLQPLLTLHSLLPIAIPTHRFTCTERAHKPARVCWLLSLQPLLHRGPRSCLCSRGYE